MRDDCDFSTLPLQEQKVLRVLWIPNGFHERFREHILVDGEWQERALNWCDRCAGINACLRTGAKRNVECGVRLLRGIRPIGKISPCLSLHRLPRRYDRKFETP